MYQYFIVFQDSDGRAANCRHLLPSPISWPQIEELHRTIAADMNEYSIVITNYILLSGPDK